MIQALQALRVDLVSLVPWVLQGLWDHQDQQDHLGWVFQEKRVRQEKEVFLGWADLQDCPDTQDQWENQEMMGRQGKTGRLEQQEKMDNQDQRVRRGPQVREGLQALRVGLDPQAEEAATATARRLRPSWACQGLGERGGPQDRQVSTEVLDPLVLLETTLLSTMMKSTTSFASRSSRSLMRGWHTTSPVCSSQSL